MIRELFLSDFSLSSCVWQSTIFIVVGLVSSFILRHRSSRAHQVLFLAMMAAVIVPIMSILVKHYELGMFVAEPVVIQSRAEDVGRVGNFGEPGIISAEEIEHKPGAIEEILPSTMAVSESAEFPWRSVVLYGWITASLILATRLLVTFVLGARLLGRALPLDCQRIEEAAHLARAKLGIDKDVMVRSSRGVRSPVIWCWRRRPVLLVPSAAGRFDNGIDWAGVLCHELAHWKRRDHISGLLAELAVCILPWHPLIWWAKSRLVRLSEQACDDWVVASGQPGTDYAESLLDLTPGGQMAFVPAVVSTKRGLAGRVHRILKDSCGNPRTGAVWTALVSIVAVCLTIVVACAQTRPAEPETPTERADKSTKSLHQAAADGDIEQVKSLIAKGKDINAKDKKEQTPLHLAVRYGHENVAKLLIVQGADVNASMRDGPWTPLLDAASTGHTKLVKLLLEKGAKVDVGDKYGYTPLYYSIWNEDKDTVRLLLTKGADVSLKPEKDYPPLHYAVWMDDMDIVKLLVDNGAKFDVKDQDGWTAFRYAAFQGSRDMVEFFVSKGADVSTFHLAACMGYLARVKDFVSQETEVDTKDELGWTPSYWALSAGQKKVFAYLLSQGADVTAKTNDGHTLLHQASKAGFTEIVKQLISKGADVSVKAKNGETPLQHAASKGHEEVVKLLVAKGADVNATSNNGKHPLGDAALAGHEDVVKLLIASGAKVNLSAKINPLSEEYRGTALHAAAQGGHSTILDLLIANGADVNLNARNGTPLHSAARGLSKVKDEKSVEIVEKLLAKGADVNAKDPRQGRTPLHNTARRGNCKAAELLIAAGADVSAKDKEGHTPLWYAKDKYTIDEDDKRIVELLRRHGAIE